MGAENSDAFELGEAVVGETPITGDGGFNPATWGGGVIVFLWLFYMAVKAIYGKRKGPPT